jgi:DnaK suppressor protein
MRTPEGRVALSGKPSGKSRTEAPKEHARQELLRRLLIQKREEIVKEAKEEIAKYTKGEANQLAETALDDGDWSVIDLSQDINLRRLETHRESLLGIDEALMKLREGSYGICEDCGGEISAERLNVMPFAIYCKDCREKREELEKATREDTIS